MLRYVVLFWRVLSSRAVKVALYLWILAWGFDRAVFWATEAAWFGSIGQSAWFGARFWAQFALFWGTFGLALISAALVMRVAARPVAGAELRTLSGVLEPLEPIRRSATRIAWLVLVVGAWIVARQIAGGWATWLLARAGDSSDPIFAVPLARLVLNALWQWSLFTLGALAFAGVLRALPLLAARQPTQPRRLWRALGAVGIVVMLTRGALYLLGWGEAVLSDGTTGSELFVGLPLAILGVALCVLAAVWCLVRPGYKKLGLAVIAALFAPHLLRALLAPLALVVPTPASMEKRNAQQTLDSWHLNDGPTISKTAPPLAAHWPIWNEEALLGLARGEVPRQAGQIVDWKRATISARAAIVAGVPAGLENWGSPHEADDQNGIEWLAFDATRSVEGRAPVVPDAQLPLRSFYGLGGRPLLGDVAANAGVPFEFWGWKMAWAWRLRDPLLMLEGARANRLLVYRGARENAERLAPFLTWDEAQLRMAPDGPRWEMTGYATTPYGRGALAASEGVFTGQNYVAPVVTLQLNPRDGRVTFQQLAPTVYADVLGITAEAKAGAMPLLNQTRGQVARRLRQKNVLNEAVWTWTNRGAQRVRYAPNSPSGVDERLAALDAAARRDWANADGANANSSATQLQMGDAVLWPDKRAPGGFWVGRSYYSSAATAGVASAGGIARSAKMWRVSLTGLAPSPIANGDEARAALVAFDLQNTATSVPKKTAQTSASDSDKQLLLQALQALDAAQKALSASNWNEWTKQSARARQLLQELVARRQ